MSDSMGISAASGGTGYYTAAIASGSKVMSAADDAAGLAIAEKENSQINGLDQGGRNAKDVISMLNTADGATDKIADSLSRIRTLAVQAQNTAVLTDDDRRMIQDEVDQLKQGIADTARNTEFNKKPLLDGSYDGYSQTGANEGQGKNIDIGDATLEALGIKDFDVSSNDRSKNSVDIIDNALSSIADTRGKIGAQTNAMEYSIQYNAIESENLTSATSRIEDADIAEMASKLSKESLLQTYQNMMQKKQQEEEAKK
ncbi:MAG: flagellin FliC5, partial [Eubacterium sp.]|nr:flagellin FliC5 [Eubacterium sp.]